MAERAEVVRLAAAGGVEGGLVEHDAVGIGIHRRDGGIERLAVAVGLVEQAGAGIVMDSNPTAEYEETRDKARALLRALDLAQAGL